MRWTKVCGRSVLCWEASLKVSGVSVYLCVYLASCHLSLHPAGGALALYVSLTAHLNLGGTFVLSSYLLAPWELQDKSITRNNSNSPILICHGLEDVKVPVPWALHCHSLVSTLNTKCKLKKYVGLGHDVNSAVQHDVQIFLTNILCQSP